MKPSLALVLTLGLATSGLVPTTASAADVPNEAVDDSTMISSLIVERLPGRTSLAAQATIEDLTDLDASRGDRLGERFETIVLDEPVTVAEATELARSLEADGLVVSASPDYPRSSVATNDPEWSNQWSLQPFNGATNAGIGLEGAWLAGPGIEDVVVAVIDTGRPKFAGADHPDMVGNVVPGYDFMSLSGNGRDPRDGNGWDANETDPGDWEAAGECEAGSPALDSSWHASHVAGIIAAESNNSLGITGINPRARVQHLRILGKCGGVTSDEIAAIRWAAGLPVSGVPNNPTPAKVINLSLGGESPCTTGEQAAIDAAVNAGSIVVVASGNSNFDLDVSDYAPANCDNVITVAATTQSGGRLNLSNFGSTVEIAAPGRQIVSTMNAGSTVATSSWTYEYKSGTSMATPMVSGVVSLMLSVEPTLTFIDVRHILQQTASPFPAGSDCSSVPANTFYCGPGIVNAQAALQGVLSHSPLGALVDVAPNRVMDTRDGTGGVPMARVGNFDGTAPDLQFAIVGAGGVPSVGVSAVSLNVTVTESNAPDEGGYVTVYPCAAGRPNVSNLNFVDRQIVPNAVIVPVGQGDICFHVYGIAHLIVDVSGWFPTGSGFATTTPNRVMDTRDGTGGVPAARVGNFDGTAPDLQFAIAGAGGVPSAGVSAVSLNVTVAESNAPDEGGYVTVYPCAAGRPNVSNLNFLDRQITPNAVIVPVGTGDICFHVYGIAHLIVDVNGWFAAGAGFTPVTPNRVMDTRDGTGGVASARVGNFDGTASDLVFEVRGHAGVPTVGVSAVSLNVTVAESNAPDEGGYVTVYPCAAGRPNVSNLNFVDRQITPNAVIVPVDAGLCFHVYGTAHLIVDVNGWFPG